MGVPIVSPVTNLAAVASAVGKVAEVKLIGKGFLMKLAVEEITNDHEGFDVYVYDRASVYNADGTAGVDAAAEAVLRVIPKQTVASSGTLLFFFDASGVPFVNKDGTLSNNERQLYVRVVPSGNGNKDYRIHAAGTSVA